MLICTKMGHQKVRNLVSKIADVCIDPRTGTGDADVVPIHVLGVTDVGLTRTSSSDLMTFALANLSDPSREGGYVVRHSRNALDDFGETVARLEGRNPFSSSSVFCAFPAEWGGSKHPKVSKLVSRSTPDGRSNTTIAGSLCTTCFLSSFSG